MVTFVRPFMLKGVDRILPAGNYRVLTDEELIEELSFPVYRRVSTMIVVPETHDLMIQARLANRDIGFVHAGQTVKDKYRQATDAAGDHEKADGQYIDIVPAPHDPLELNGVGVVNVLPQPQCTVVST